MKTTFLCLAAVASIASMASAASASTVYANLAGDDSIGVTYTAQAGTYEINEIAGTYTATDLQTNFGSPAVDCPSATPGSCTSGYSSNFEITVDGKSTFYGDPAPVGGPYAYGVYDTAADALSAFRTEVGPVYLTLPAETTVNYKVPDTYYPDNTGGISLSISQVSAAPEPGTWALMIAGLGVAGLALRRRSVSALVAA